MSTTSPTTVPRPLQLVDSNAPSTPTSSVLSPRSPFSALPTPPSTSRRPASVNPRRQSSISYFPSNHVSIRSPTSPSFSFKPSVKRSNSLGLKTNETFTSLKTREKGDRRSLGSENGLASPMAERGPLTLTEKHADLLQFIAQKESKCLELRSQLMAHEEELGQLKRKWERIVSRGMDRAYTPAFPSHNMPSSSTPSSSRHATSPSLASSLLNPSNGAVLDGIKEGVQGVGRLLAAGLELSSSSSPSATATSPVGPGLSSVSRAAMTPALKRAKHVNTQSVSSVSTSGTASSSVLSAGTRLSQSSASSLSFPEDEEDRALLEEDEDSTIHQRSMHETLEQTMSSEFTPPTTDKSAKLIRRRSREAPKLPSPSFFDGHSPVSPNASLAGAPVSSWVGSMGSTMGKKWEEIQKGETFTKSQKRASLLISDVSQSFFAALASPVPSQPSHPTRSLAASPLSISTNANPFLATTTLFASASPSASPVPSSGSLLEDDEIGDLDMTNGKGLGEVLIPVSLSPNLSTLSGGKKPEETKVQPAPTPSLDDDDDWNW